MESMVGHGRMEAVEPEAIRGSSAKLAAKQKAHRAATSSGKSTRDQRGTHTKHHTPMGMVSESELFGVWQSSGHPGAQVLRVRGGQKPWVHHTIPKMAPCSHTRRGEQKQALVVDKSLAKTSFGWD